MNLRYLAFIVCLLLPSVAAAALRPEPPRQVISLDGQWQIAEGSMDAKPQDFSHTIPVPGLVDMAQPAFDEVGKKSDLRQAFWYRRQFKLDGPLAEVAILKLHKARYGTKVWVNGQLAGEHLPCFTPAYLDVRSYLKGEGQANELVVRVGADRDSMPQDMPTGWDFEKYLYLPGIYDSVELILTAPPRIVNVQTVPDIVGKKVRVVAEVAAGSKACDFQLKADVAEAVGGQAVGSAQSPPVHLEANAETKVELVIPIANCRLWSPDDPFLYVVKLGTGSDAAWVRFGMRSFAFDRANKRAVLNGKPYYMRGTNVTCYRFFEDALRGDKPWRAEWVQRLHQKYKTMHWSSIRYCIGFPPEIWYDIADEEGFLIQDEFPIWLLGKAPENPVAEKIIPEYTEWMRERWNHPCVVIWDAQNESQTKETGKALQAVRHLDLSDRPWENGWAEPQSEKDCVESHPYLFIRDWNKQKPFRLSELAAHSGVPHLHDAQKVIDVPIIINEYDWLWLNRDGTVTCLTEKVYENILGPNSTVDQRRLVHARNVAALTEFWRGHREAAGVLHFCGLGYSRPGDKPRPEGGATSDDFTDIEKLTFEPLFEEYVSDAFHPVGLMLNFWAEEVAAGAKQEIQVYVVNDLPGTWSGEVKLSIDGQPAIAAPQSCAVDSCGRQILTFQLEFPREPGKYTLAAEIAGVDAQPVRSLRDFQVK